MRSAIILGLGLLLLPAAQAQTQPDIAAVLRRVSQRYKATTQYEFIGEGTCGGEQARTSEPFRMLFAFKAPNKYRVRSNAPCLKPGEPDPGESLRVNDGSTLWAYSSKENQYVSIPAELFGNKQPDSIDQATMSRYRGIADIAGQVKFVREEDLSVGASKVDCYVVSVPKQEYAPAQTWWIDKASYHVVRIDGDESSIVFTTIKLNEPLPDSLFKFVPPPGAKKGELDQ
jgi:outer membrane lipoprotein-sorting protein